MPAVVENKGSEKDKKPILTTIFAKSKNFKPGIYANKAYKWIPGYGIFIKLILHGRMAFGLLSHFDHMIGLCMAAAHLRYYTVCRQACFRLIQVINIDLKQIIFWDLLQMLQYSAPPPNIATSLWLVHNLNH